MAESEEELKSQFLKMKVESEKVGLKLNIQKMKIMASGPISSVQFSSVQSLSCVRLFATPWTAAHQTSLSTANSQSSLKLMSIESVMPSNHLILCCHLLLPPSIFPSIRVFSNESVLCIRSDQISHLVVSNSLRPHEPQHTRPPCPSPTPGVYPNSCPLSQ